VRYRVTHSSAYQYTGPAALSLNEAWLRPRDTGFQTVVSHRYRIDPEPDFHRTRTDFFGNPVDVFAFEKPHRRLEIVSESEVEVTAHRPQGNEEGPQTDLFRLPSPFLRTSAGFAAYGRVSFLPGRPWAEALADLNQRVFRDFTYDPKATEISTPVEEFFQKRRGVCQDFAHFLIAVLRSLGIPARYVSGYLNTVPPPGKAKVWGADASHAWVSVHGPGSGWLDVDPTNGIAVQADHVTLGWGRDYGDVPPLKGVVLGGGTQTLEVQVTVLPLGERR
jgi:transglutaminase-like putative cysteine protease